MSQNQSSYDTVLYHVKPGDSLDKIIKHYFGKVTPEQRTTILYSIQLNNPNIKNIDKIYANEIIQLDVPPQQGTAPVVNLTKKQVQTLQTQMQAGTSKEKSMLSTLTPLLFGAGGVATGTMNKVMSSNSPILTAMTKNYDDFKAGIIKKGAYDYRRKKLVEQFKNRMGPIRKILTRSRSSSELLKISSKAGTAPVKNITQTINNMGKMAKYAGRGNALLSVGSLYLGCRDIGNTNSVQKKNEILVETVAGIGSGILVGAALMFAFTPIGWVAILAIGVTTAMISYGAGKGAAKVYDAFGQNIDLASATGVSQLCSK